MWTSSVLTPSLCALLLGLLGLPVVSLAASANQILEAGEVCDGADLGGNSCSSFPGFRSGTLSCRSDRRSFNFSGCVAGAVIRATECTQSELKTLVENASDGDTILVPAKSCDWGAFSLNVANKNIVLKGAGIDSTTITSSADNFTAISVSGSKPVRVTGFTFALSGIEQKAILIAGNAMNWRVDHNKFKIRRRGYLLRTEGATYGLVDNNTTMGMVNIDLVGGNGAVWKKTLDLGTINAVYIEHNIQESRYDGEVPTEVWMFLENNGASRFVYRYNQAAGYGIGTHENRGALRGPFSYEVYRNAFTRRTTDVMGVPVALRAGTGVVYENSFANATSQGNGIQLYDNSLCEWHIAGTNFPLCNGSRATDGNRVEDSGTNSQNGQLVDTTKNWPVNKWVGCTVRNTNDPGSFGYITANLATSLTTSLQSGTRNSWISNDAYTISCGYPCLDQVGRSTDFSATQIHPQAFEPIYAWDNTVNGAPGLALYAATFICPLAQFQIVEGRDFYNNTARPNYSAYPDPHPLTYLDTESAPMAPTLLTVERD